MGQAGSLQATVQPPLTLCVSLEFMAREWLRADYAMSLRLMRRGGGMNT
jgi:hypothetical protein